MRMRTIRACATTAVVLLLFTGMIAAETPDEPYKFFRKFAGLNEDQIAAIRSGQAGNMETFEGGNLLVARLLGFQPPPD